MGQKTINVFLRPRPAAEGGFDYVIEPREQSYQGMPDDSDEIGVFAVLVTQDGGSAGSPTANCSWTYTVKDLAGNTIATGQTPAVPRFPLTEYNKPSDGSVALAYYDQAGFVHLYHVAEEIPTTDKVKLQAEYQVSNNQFQVKYQYVRVIEADDKDADWTLVHQGTVCAS